MNKNIIQLSKFKNLARQMKQKKLYTTYRVLLNYYYHKPRYYFTTSAFITAIKENDVNTITEILQQLKQRTINQQNLSTFIEHYLFS